MIWHNATSAEVLAELKCDKERGLPKGIVEERQKIYGYNILDNAESKSLLKNILMQFNNTYIIILLIVALIYTILTFTGNIAKWWEPFMIFSVTIAMCVFAGLYKYKSNKLLYGISDNANSKCVVLRDSKTINISSNELVPGDIILLKEGNLIPADGRIIDSFEFRCDEFSLTGETVPVEKNHNLIFEDITPVSKRKNMVYAGCSVIHGNARVVVTQIAADTEKGRKNIISNESGENSSPIMEKIPVIGKIFSISTLIIATIYIILSILFNLSQSFLPLVFSNLLTALSLIVAAIPETLFAIATVIMALGLKRMLTGNIIPRNPSCIETMGGVSVICTDKTGILTENELVVSKVYTNNKLYDLNNDTIDDQAKLLLKLSLMCTDPKEKEIKNIIDDAIFGAGFKYLGMEKSECDNLYPRLSGIPFDSERKIMSTVNMIEGKPFAIVKGAAEIVLSHCISNTEEYEKVVDNLCGEGLQVICIAIKKLNDIPANPDLELFENGLSVVGMIAMSDHLQGDALDYIEICEKSGIRTVLLTGDHINAAKEVAVKMGIMKDGMLSISSEELEKISDEELYNNIENYCVFARVTPQDKKRIIDAWMKTGKIVAATGKNTDDATVLQTADIGCTMGEDCPDVAKEASDIIITDGRFSGLVRSILRSRGIFDNIRKCVHYLITCNCAELICALFGVFIFKTSPLAGIHFLTLNFLTDFGPAISLGMQPTDLSTKYQAPKKKYSNILSNKMTVQSIIQAVVLAIVTLVAFALGKNSGVGSTMAFATLTLSQLAVSLNLSSDDLIFKGAILKNKHLLYSSSISFLFTMIVVLSPISVAFSFNALKFIQFIEVLLLVLIVTFIGELYKYIRKRLEIKNPIH